MSFNNDVIKEQREVILYIINYIGYSLLFVSVFVRFVNIWAKGSFCEGEYRPV